MVQRSKVFFLFSVISLILSVLLFFMLGEGRGYISLWWPRILCLGIAALTTFSIYFLGSLLIPYFYSAHDAVQGLLSFALGTLLFGVLILLAGTLGYLTRSTALFFLLLTNALGWREWGRLFQCVGQGAFWQGPTWSIASKILAFCVFCLICLNLLHAFFIPLDYDVLEYHLGSPAEYHKEGKIFFFANNVYANFPQNLEMIAFFSMQLLGKWYGAMAAQIILWGYGFALLGATFLLARKIGTEEEALLAALLVYALPWTANLLRVYYVEVPQAVFLLLALFLCMGNAPGFFPKRQPLFCGLMLGIAAGFKYTVIFLGFIAFIPLFFAIPQSYQARLRALGWIAVGFFLAFGPWALRSFIHTGNPLYPLFNTTLIPGYWTDAMYARFQYAHEAHNLSILALGKRLLDVFLIGSHTALLHLVLLFPAIFWLIKKLRTLACFIFLWLFLWLFFTHQIDRFIYIIFVLICLPMSFVFSYLAKNLPSPMVVLTTLLALFTLYHHTYLTIPDAYDYLLGMKTKEEILEKHYLPYPAEEFLNQNVSEKVLMVGEARVFYLDMPLVMGTVFDDNLLESLFSQYSTAEKIAHALKAREIHYLYFHWNEVARLQTTYSFPWKGQKMPGYLWIEPSRLTDFLRNQAVKVFPENSKKIENIEIYKLK